MSSLRPLAFSRAMCMLIGMQVYVFTAAFDPTVRAFSQDSTGSNLPTEHAPWRRDSRGAVITINPEIDPIAKEINEKGYLVVLAGDQV
jgi:hypothetical protein